MGEVSLSTSGFLSKLSSLFNNQMFSDVEFFFDGKEQIPKMYGHKLILALRSDYFASMFYGNENKLYESNISSTNKHIGQLIKTSITIPSTEKESFYLLLRFLYTDDIQFHSARVAEDLYKLSKQYAVHELASKCMTYLLQEGITIDNIFQKYECALSENLEMLLKDCRTFVCRNTESVFDSNNFYYASDAVVEDIVKQNDLMLPTEMLLINVVLTWCKVNCTRNKVPSDDKHLRECIFPFMKHLRFLTLTQDEFDNFVGRYNILSSKECYALTSKILKPDSDVKFPENICSLKNKRGIFPLDLASASESKGSKSKSIKFNIKTSQADNLLNEMIAQNAPIPLYIQKNSPDVDVFEPKGINLKAVTNRMKSPPSNRVSYEVNVTQFSENAASQLKTTKFRSSPNINTGSSHAFGYPLPVASYSIRCFSFPLLSETPKSFRDSFPRDNKCYSTFKMKSGNIKVFGFELNIRNKGASEKLAVDVDVRGFSISGSKVYRNELTNNVLRVEFSKPAILYENQKGEIDVAIDNLFLNRCSVCSSNNKTCELNNGSKFMCEIFLNSNQKFDNDIFFLINRLLYMPC